MTAGAELSGVVQAIGPTAGAPATLAFPPRVVKTWRTRSTGGICLWMVLVFLTVVGLWLADGLLIGDAPLAAANGATFLLAGVVLYFTLRHG